MKSANLSHFLFDETAGAALEYLIITGLMSCFYIMAIHEYKDRLITLFDEVSRDLNKFSKLIG